MSLTEQKIFWEKEKILITSIFFFFHNVFQTSLSSGSLKVRFCGQVKENGSIIRFTTLVFHEKNVLQHLLLGFV